MWLLIQYLRNKAFLFFLVFISSTAIKYLYSVDYVHNPYENNRRIPFSAEYSLTFVSVVFIYTS